MSQNVDDVLLVAIAKAGCPKDLVDSGLQSTRHPSRQAIRDAFCFAGKRGDVAMISAIADYLDLTDDIGRSLMECDESDDDAPCMYGTERDIDAFATGAYASAFYNKSDAVDYFIKTELQYVRMELLTAAEKHRDISKRIITACADAGDNESLLVSYLLPSLATF